MCVRICLFIVYLDALLNDDDNDNNDGDGVWYLSSAHTHTFKHTLNVKQSRPGSKIQQSEELILFSHYQYRKL